MTEQEKQEIIEEIKKYFSNEKDNMRKDGGNNRIFRNVIHKWFKYKPKNSNLTKMESAFGDKDVSLQVWEIVRRLTCKICGKRYVRQLTDIENADEIAERICQFVYDLRLEVKQNVNK